MLEEKLKEAIVAELKGKSANGPQSLSIDNAVDLVVNGKIDLDDVAMVIAGAVAGRPLSFRCKPTFPPAGPIRNRDCRRTFSQNGCKNGWT